MLLVLLVHANFLSLGAPSAGEIFYSPVSSFFRFFVEALAIICVNVFILITGWFGIRPKVSRFCALIFQVFFIGAFIYIFLLILGKVEPWGVSGWITLLATRKDLWFVGAYLFLYILAPVLNAFVSSVSKKTFQKYLLAFFIIQTVGFFFKWKFIRAGYTPLSFAGLYLLARYMRLYHSRFFSFNRHCDMAIYVCATLLTTILSMILVGYAGQDGWLLYGFVSPIVIVSSVYFFLFFTKISFHSRAVNWVASSAFAVYLFHCDPLLLNRYYLRPIRVFLNNDSTLQFLFHTALMMMVAFFLAIVIDKIRILVWNGLLLIYHQLFCKN